MFEGLQKFPVVEFGVEPRSYHTLGPMEFKDEVLGSGTCIRFQVPLPWRTDEWARKPKYCTGYKMAHVMTTKTKENQDAASAYIAWYNGKKYLFDADIIQVMQTHWVKGCVRKVKSR